MDDWSTQIIPKCPIDQKSRKRKLQKKPMQTMPMTYQRDIVESAHPTLENQDRWNFQILLSFLAASVHMEVKLKCVLLQLFFNNICLQVIGFLSHSEICGMPFSKVIQCCHEWFFLVPLCALTSIPT